MWRNYQKLPVSIRSSSVWGVVAWCAFMLIAIWYLHAELYTVYGPFLKLRDWGPSPSWAIMVQQNRWLVRILAAISIVTLCLLEIRLAIVSSILRNTVNQRIKLFVLLLGLGLISGVDFILPGYLRATDDAESYTTISWLIRDIIVQGQLPIWSNWGDMGFPLMQFYSPMYYTAIALISFITHNIWSAAKILHLVLHVMSVLVIFLYVHNLTKSRYAGLVASFAVGFTFYRYHVFFYLGALNMAPTFVIWPLQLYLIDKFIVVSNKRYVGAILALTSALGLVCHAYFGGYGGLFAAIYGLIRVLTFIPNPTTWRTKLGLIAQLYVWLGAGVMASLFYTLPALLESNLSVVQAWVGADFLLPSMSVTDVLTFEGSQGGSGWWGGYLGISVMSISFIGYIWALLRGRVFVVAPFVLLLSACFLAIGPYYLDFPAIFGSVPGGSVVFLFHSPGDYLVYVVIMSSIGVGVCMAEIQRYLVENNGGKYTVQLFSNTDSIRSEWIIFFLCGLIALDMFRYSLFVNYMIPETPNGSPSNRVLVHQWLNDNKTDIDGRVLDVDQSDIVWHIPMTANLPTYVSNGFSSIYSAAFVVGLRRFDPRYLLDEGRNLMSIANTSLVIADVPSVLDMYPGAINISDEAVIIPIDRNLAMLASRRVEVVHLDTEFREFEQASMLTETPYSNLANEIGIDHAKGTSEFLPVMGELPLLTDIISAAPLVVDVVDHHMESQYVRIEYSMSTPAYLQLSYSYYPYLRVLIDGKPVKTFATSFGLLGLESPAGVHTIEIVPYLSDLRLIVGVVNICTLILLTFLWVTSNKNIVSRDIMK